jgi:hypothetical protein
VIKVILCLEMLYGVQGSLVSGDAMQIDVQRCCKLVKVILCLEMFQSDQESPMY